MPQNQLPSVVKSHSHWSRLTFLAAICTVVFGALGACGGDSGSPDPGIDAGPGDDRTRVAFAVEASSTADESPGDHSVTVTLSAPAGSLDSAITVDVSDTGTGSATSGVDYTAIATATVTFAAGSPDGATETVSLGVLADGLAEGDETVVLTLSNVTGPGILDERVTHTATITDDDSATLQFSLATSVTSGENPGDHQVAVTLTGGTLAADVSVDVSDNGSGTATSGADYSTISPTTITFAAGSSDGAAQTLSIAVLSDNFVEGDETVTLELSNVTGAASLGAETTHVATIPDDDTAVISFASATSTTVSERTTTHDVAVTLTLPAGTLGTPITVDVSDSGGGTATTGLDYNVTSPSTLTFPVGSASGATQTFPIAVRFDSFIEGDETVELAASNIVGPAVLTAPTNHTATITDDDRSTVEFSAATSIKPDEIATLDVTVVLRGGIRLDPLTVDIADLGTGTATSGIDYEAFPSTEITFPAGSRNNSTQTFAISMIPDLVFESDKTIDLELSNVSGFRADIGSRTAHTATIRDDDRLLGTKPVEGKAAGILVGTEFSTGTTPPCCRLSAAQRGRKAGGGPDAWLEMV